MILQDKSKHTVSETDRFWLDLDNAAKIFPSVITKEITAVFRITAILKNPVKIKPLRKAVLLAEKRFPYFRVQLKEGFFWYYLEHLPQHIPIEVDEEPYCRRFPKGGLLVRVRVKNTTINIEFSHILSDGGGAIEFFKTILVLYFMECGVKVPEEYQLIDPADQITEEEYEDAYKRYFKEDIPPMVKKSKAFHLPFSLKPKPRLSTMSATFSVEQIKRVANAKGVSINVYLVSVYLYTLQMIYENMVTLSKHKHDKILRVQVPINLRNIFPSKTMRNFSLFVMPEIDLRLGHYTFDEIIKTVFHQSKLETDKKLINKNISRNVGSERKIYIRGIPLFLKSLILRMKYYSLGTSQYSGVVTNLGEIELPEEIGKLVDRFVVIPPPPNKMLKLSCGVVGFGDKLVLSFANITTSTKFEEIFFQFMGEQNITFELETNK